MAGLPVTSGALHDTSSCVFGVGECCHTDGAEGAGGGSFTSVTSMVTGMILTEEMVSPPPVCTASTCTTTLYDVFAS